MISYADLERTFRLERANPTLQKLQDSFYDEATQLAASPGIGDYAATIRDYTAKIYSLRVNKIVHYAGRAAHDTKPPDNILSEERILYERILAVVVENRAKVLDRKPQMQPVEEKKPTVKVRIKQAMPAIIGSDSREYGPYKEDDVAELPEDSAEILVARKAAEKL